MGQYELTLAVCRCAEARSGVVVVCETKRLGGTDQDPDSWRGLQGLRFCFE